MLKESSAAPRESESEVILGRYKVNTIQLDDIYLTQRTACGACERKGLFAKAVAR